MFALIHKTPTFVSRSTRLPVYNTSRPAHFLGAISRNMGTYQCSHAKRQNDEFLVENYLKHGIHCEEAKKAFSDIYYEKLKNTKDVNEFHRDYKEMTDELNRINKQDMVCATMGMMAAPALGPLGATAVGGFFTASYIYTSRMKNLVDNKK